VERNVQSVGNEKGCIIQASVKRITEMTAKIRGAVSVVTALKVTAMVNGFRNTKVCRKANVAAEHWAEARTYHWWNEGGSSLGRPAGYNAYDERFAKLYRRTLPIFKKYLP